jgi:hypothetical protein
VFGLSGRSEASPTSRNSSIEIFVSSELIDTIYNIFRMPNRTRRARWKP